MRHWLTLSLVIIALCGGASFATSGTIAALSATGFENDWEGCGPGPVSQDATAEVGLHDGVWAPRVEACVPFDYFANGATAGYLDALSLHFDLSGALRNANGALTLRFYIRKGTYSDERWHALKLYAGSFNPAGEECLFLFPCVTTADEFPADAGWEGWFERPVPPEWVSGTSLDLTVRIWNARVDAIQLDYVEARPDLRIALPAGWAAPLVPRSDAVATPRSCDAPAELVGDSAATFVNWSVETSGGGAALDWTYGVFLDGVRRASYPSASATPVSVSGSICGQCNEGSVLHMSAPDGAVFTSVEFASYGTPTGPCGSFATSACHASTSASIVGLLAMGNTACDIFADNSVFGDPCGGTYKRLAVQLGFSGSAGLSMQNQGGLSVPGGWHTLGGMGDADSVISELDEGNNFTQGQWLWRPHDIFRVQPRLRAAPPVVGSGAHPNCDAVRIVRDPRYAWVVAVGGVAQGDDYDVVTYDDYSGAQAGLSHEIGASRTPGSETEFVVGTFLGTPTTIYPTTQRVSTAGAPSPYVIDYSDARGRTSDSDLASWHEEVLSAGRIADVFEAYFTAGVPRYIFLKRLAGSSDLAFEVMGGLPGGIYGRGASGTRGTSVAYGSAFDTLLYSAEQTGWHPIVVYRATQELTESATYSLAIQQSGITGIDQPRISGEPELRKPHPSPASGAVRLVLSLPGPEIGEVSIFDLSGRRVAVLCNSTLPAGENRLEWNAEDGSGARVAPGLYLVRARVGSWSGSRRVVIR